MSIETGEAVLFEAADGVGWITLARGDSGNTFGTSMARQLAGAVAAAEASDLPVVVLRASGRFFCAGGDLREFAEAEDARALIEGLASTLADVVERLVAMPSIVVSAVQGPAAGAGVPLAAAADIVIAAESASFTFAYTRAGLSPDGGATVLTSTLGLHRTLAWALLNPTVSAAEAQAAGLVARVTPDAGLADATRSIAQQIARGSRDAHVATKRLIRAAAPPVAGQLAAEAVQIGLQAAGPDGQEGIASFLGKRPARFPSSGHGVDPC